MQRRTLSALAAALGLALVLAACGAQPDGASAGRESDAAREPGAPATAPAADPGGPAAADPNEPVSHMPGAGDTAGAPSGEPAAVDEPAAEPAPNPEVQPAPAPEPIVVEPSPEPVIVEPSPEPVTVQPAAPSPQPSPAEPAAGAVAFETVAAGAYSGLRQQGAWLIRDAAALQSLWQQHTSQVVPAPDAPEVDFSREAVILVSLGERNTGGYSVRIVGVEVTDGKLVVSVVATQPGPGDMVTMAFTQPFHMVTIPLTGGALELEVLGLPEGGGQGLDDR